MVTIQAGDVLLYRGSGFWSWAIRVKTWGPVSHCELANSGATAFASRDGQGVQTYPLDKTERLWAVLRPVFPVDMTGVRAFHRKCIGQRYDWWGLARFFTFGTQSLTKQFCSEYVTRLLRAGGVEPFTGDIDADLVAPSTFLYSPQFTHVWHKDPELVGGSTAGTDTSPTRRGGPPTEAA